MMTPHEDEPAAGLPGLERRSMAWPPSPWERTPGAWRDDVQPGPEPLTPYEPRTARPARTRAGVFSLAREVVETLVLTALIFLGIRLVVQNFRIEGRSMEPTLHSGQYLLVNKLAYRGLADPHRGDIVVFEAWSQDKDFIKRVIGLPGDELEIKANCVHINGSCIEEPYLDGPTTQTVGPITLGPDEYYVMGDNRGNSSDSRAYGPLPREKIIGRAWLTYWPPGEIGIVDTGGQGFASR